MVLIDRRARRARLLVAAGVASLALTVASASQAIACGGFFPPIQEGARRPSLAYEQTLIVFDAEQGKQHFIREVTFRGTSSTFGFVVPAPTRPTVAAVKTSPFADLRDSFPFERPQTTRGRGLLRIGAGGSAGGGSSGVTVLEKRQVGSFTAFVLAASDRDALSKWLRDNGFTSTRQADAWLAKYVPLGFYYVAMRYRPRAGGASSDAVHAETMRISFDTPVPYYPYQEPASKAPQDDAEPRLAELWLVSQRAFVPVASRERGGKSRWVRPFRAGHSYKAADRGALASALAEARSLLPKGRLQVQRFMDQKLRRPGFGDVVFVPSDKQPLTAETTAQVRRMLPPATDPTALLSSELDAKTFPEIATEPGASFDPDLRDRVAPVRSAADTDIAATVQVDGIASDGDVDPGEVTVAFKRVRGLLRVCYLRALRINPTIEADRLYVRFELDASGTAIHVEAPGPPELEACVRLGVSRARFPVPKSGTASVAATVAFRRE